MASPKSREGRRLNSVLLLLKLLVLSNVLTAALCVGLALRQSHNLQELDDEWTTRFVARVEELEEWWEIDRTNQNAQLRALELYIERMLDEDGERTREDD